MNSKKYAGTSRGRRMRRLARARRKYGIDPSGFQFLERIAAGKCMVCRVRPHTDIDHDHPTGKVRGLLCAQCNRMLGFAKDSPAVLRAGAAYLELFQ